MSESVPTTAATQTLVLADGRKLCYSVHGVVDHPADAPLPSSSLPSSSPQPTTFYFHSFPGSHHEGAGWAAAAARAGLRIVAVSRPGYGGSTADAGRSLLAFADDVMALADDLGVNRFAVFGVSGGGPYVLACVRRVPAARLAGAIVISGLWPASLGLGGMMLSNRVLFNLAPWVPTALVGRLFDAAMGRTARTDSSGAATRAELEKGFTSLPDVDRACAAADDGWLFDLLAASLRGAFQDGPAGTAHEAALFGSPWGFALEDLPVRPGELLVYHGRLDIHVPARMAEEGVSVMKKGVRLTVEEDEAHLSLFYHKMDDIIGELKQMLEVPL